MEFSWRLRYRVLDEILCGTSFKPFLVQITRLAWLEQLQRAGQAGLASANLGPRRCGHNNSWTNQMRGEGLKRPVTIAACMATESCPAPFLKQTRQTVIANSPQNFLKCIFNNEIHKTRKEINFFTINLWNQVSKCNPHSCQQHWMLLRESSACHQNHHSQHWLCLLKENTR